jgi:hypothetical protein
MEGQEIVLQNPNKIVTFTVRDFAAMAFRRSRTLMFCFFGILLGSLLAGVLWPWIPWSHRSQPTLWW